MSKPFNRRFFRSIALFLLFPILIGVLLYARIQSVLRSYTEGLVKSQAINLTQLTSMRLSSRMEELDRVAGYLRDGIVPEENMGSAAARLLFHDGQSSMGIVRLGGVPVSGQYLPPSEYPAVQNAFRGKSTVRYNPDKGFLFTAPIYQGRNIKYVLYEFIDETTLLGGLGKTYFDGKANFMLADNDQQIVMPRYGQAVSKLNGIRMTFSELAPDMMRAGFGTVYLDTGEGKAFAFVSELEQPNLFLLGVVPYETAAGDLMSIFHVVLMILGLMLVLCAIGTARIVQADARIRESDELRRAKQAVEAAYDSKSRFLASMSHELRTPINVIMGMDEMILREAPEENIRELAMDIRTASQILLALINDVLDFSKIESGMLTILPGEYQLISLVRELTLLSENRARTKSLEFILEVQPELPSRLIGDDLRLQQILTNLLTNAVKYTQEGTVTLQISQKSLEGDTIVLHCAVTDTGSGIKPEDIEKLMKLTPFTRVDENRNRKVEGSGLGLPIIINLLRLMGSELKVDSVYGEGSTFWFDLEQRVADASPIGDVRKRMDEEVKQYEHHVICYAPRARVMVVDDNALNRKIFVNLLKQTKIQVTPVSSGAKCLQLVQEEHFDLIFMDHLMPEMDGMETLRRLKELPDNLCKDTPVVALTANVYNGAQEQYVSLGFNAFLAKPIASEKLEELLIKMLPEEYLEEPPTGTVTQPSSPPPQTDELPEIEGVNWEFALLRIQDRQLIWDALCDFYQSLDREKQEITELAACIAQEDALKTYRTRVHALKSTAAMVGILSVSELARMLEGFSTDGERDRIQMLTPILVELLDKTQDRLRPFMDRQPPEQAPVSLPVLLSLLESLRIALDRMDIGTADAVISELERCACDAPVQEGIRELSALVAEIDFEEAGTVLERIRSMLELDTKWAENG